MLYDFCSQFNCEDGYNPIGSLIDVKGTLYGTTFYGGSSGNCFASCGTVFSLDPNTRMETVLHSFCSQLNCADGSTPYAGLIDVKGTLYGTTLRGGSGTNGSCEDSCGTVFSLDPNTAAETVIYTFCSQPGCKDGESPFASLIHVNGTLYGTTATAGANGGGTVFALKKF